MFFLFGILGGLLPIGLIILVVAAFSAGRNEPDPENQRPRAVFFSALTYIGLFVALFGAFMTASAALSFTDDSSDDFAGEWSAYTSESDTGDFSVEIGPDGEEQVIGDDGEEIEVPDEFFDAVPSDEADDYEYSDDNHDETSGLIVGLITLLIGAGLVRFSEPQLRATAQRNAVANAVYTRHLYLVCFTALAVAVGALGFTVFAVYGVAAPDWAGMADRGEAARQLTVAGALTLGAAVLFRRHWQFADAANEPVAPEPESFIEEPPVKKRAPARKAAPPKN